MNGENRFSVRDVLKTSWHGVHGAKWPIWAPQLVMFAIYFCLAFVMVMIAVSTGSLPKPGVPVGIGFYLGLMLLELIVIFLLSPLAAGIQMVGLKRHRGETVSAKTGFHYWNKWIPLGISVLFLTIGNLVVNQIFSLLIAFSTAATIPVLVIIFSILMVVATLLYFTFFLFNMLFIADKNKGPWGALGHSAKMVAPHWFRVLVLLLSLVVIGIIIVLPAVLGFLCPLLVIKILGVVVSLVFAIWGLPYANLIFAGIFHRLSGSE